MSLAIERGFSEGERAEVAVLYWQAFGPKLGRILGPERRALEFLRSAIDPAFALVARDPGGTLLGVAGFKTDRGGLVSGGLSELARIYGWFGSLWRGLLLGLLEREHEPGVLQMDGIFVAEAARGQGVGGRLLDAITEEASRAGARVVRLDVIDTNPRAQALYQREGFVAVSRARTWPLRPILGFASALRMERPVPSGSEAGDVDDLDGVPRGIAEVKRG